MKKLSLKQIAAVVIAVVLGVMPLTACGGTSGRMEYTNTIDDPWWTTTGTLEKDSDGKVVYKDVEIRMTYVVGGQDETPFKELLNQFEDEHPGIKIRTEQISSDIYEKTTADAVMQNVNPPDLIMSHQKGHKNLADNRIIQPFNEAMEASGIEISMDDYAESLAQYSDCDYDGYLFSVPVDAASSIVFYNKKMLEKYNLQLPKTHADVIAALDTVARGEKGNVDFRPCIWNFYDAFFTRFAWLSALSQNGASFYGDVDGKKYRANWASTPENLQSFLDGIKSMRDFTEHDPPLADYNSGTSSTKYFLEDNYLFLFSTPWGLRDSLDNYMSVNNVTFDQMLERVGMTSMEGWFALDPDADTAHNIFGDSHYFAMSRSVTDITKKAAICEFVKWFTQTISVGVKWAEAGHVSACTKVANSPEYAANRYVSNYVAKAIPNIDNFCGFGTTPWFKDTYDKLQSLISAVQANKTSEQDAESVRRKAKEVNDLIYFAETDFNA